MLRAAVCSAPPFAPYAAYLQPDSRNAAQAAAAAQAASGHVDEYLHVSGGRRTCGGVRVLKSTRKTLCGVRVCVVDSCPLRGLPSLPFPLFDPVLNPRSTVSCPLVVSSPQPSPSTAPRHHPQPPRSCCPCPCCPLLLPPPPLIPLQPSPPLPSLPPPLHRRRACTPSCSRAPTWPPRWWTACRTRTCCAACSPCCTAPRSAARTRRR